MSRLYVFSLLNCFLVMPCHGNEPENFQVVIDLVGKPNDHFVPALLVRKAGLFDEKGHKTGDDWLKGQLREIDKAKGKKRVTFDLFFDSSEIAPVTVTDIQKVIERFNELRDPNVLTTLRFHFELKKKE